MFFARGLLTFVIMASLWMGGQVVTGLGARRITGQIRIDGQTAPEGVLVLLDRARGRDASFVNGSGELGNTMTDSRGKFSFENVDAGMEHPEGRMYVVTVRYPGYRTTTQILDLTSTPVGYANLELRRDTSKDAPNVPPGGPSATVSAKQPSSPKAQEELAKGQQLLIQKRDPAASIKNFKKVLEMEPQYGPAYVLLGTAYVQIQDWPSAQLSFEKATKLEGNNATAFFGVGYALNEQRQFQDAIKPLQHSLELNPDSAEAEYELGRSLWALGKWKESEPHARKSIAIDKDFALSHILMGNIYWRKYSDSKEASRRSYGQSAIAEFENYLRLAPNGPGADPAKAMVDKIKKDLAKE